MSVAVNNSDRLIVNTPQMGSTSPAAIRETSSPLLSGSNVTVSEPSDLQRLMDELKMDQEEARRKLTLRQFAIAFQQLTAQNEHLSEAQTAALEKVSNAATDLEAAKEVAESTAQDVSDKEQAVAEAQKKLADLLAAWGKQAATVADLEKSLAELKAAINDKSAGLDVMIENLNELVEAQKKSREEREKEIRAKEEKAEETAEEVREESVATEEDEDLQRQIDDLTAQISALKTEISGLQGQAEALSGRISAGKEVLANQKSAVSEAQAALKKAQDELANAQTAAALAKGAVDAAEAALNTALEALDKVGLAAVAAALDAAATKILKIPNEDTDDKSEEKTEAIKKLAEDLTRTIEERNDEDLEKLIAKLPDALDWLARHTVEKTMDADLPDFRITA